MWGLRQRGEGRREEDHGGCRKRKPYPELEACGKEEERKTPQHMREDLQALIPCYNLDEVREDGGGRATKEAFCPGSTISQVRSFKTFLAVP